MADKTIQEYLNTKAGTVGALLSKQGALNVLAGTTGKTSQDAANTYAATSGKTLQEALNVKAGTTGKSKQEAAKNL